MSSFFTLPSSQKKRKRTDDKATRTSKRRQTQPSRLPGPAKVSNEKNGRQRGDDESISGSDSDEEEAPVGEQSDRSESEATSEEGETAAERRARLAERYLENIRQEIDDTGFDAADIDQDIIARRLKSDADEAKGRQFRLIASKLDFSASSLCHFRADTECTTAVAIHPPYAYTVSKDRALIKWELLPPVSAPATNARTSTRPPRPHRKQPKNLIHVRGIKKPHTHGHKAPIISLAASPCGKYIATGSTTDRRLIVWSADTLIPLKTFTTHRDSITSLAFSPQSPSPSPSQPTLPAQLFSGSADRTLKTYTLSPSSLSYIETLYGHQDSISSLAALAPDTCVSTGSRDRSARVWKVVEEMQSVFRGDSAAKATYQTGSLDCIAALPPAHFVTGSDAGALQLWSVHRKKAVFTVEAAHGIDEPEPLEKVSSEMGEEVLERLRRADTRRAVARGVTALAVVGDVVLSGSWDGWVRCWRVSEEKRTILPLGVVGCVPQPMQQNGTSGTAEATNGISTTNGTLPLSLPDSSLSFAPPPPVPGPVRGVINSLAAFERRTQVRNEYGGFKDGETAGLCIVAGTGKEMRLGRWRKFPGGKNGAVVMEVPLLRSGVEKDGVNGATSP